MGITSSAVGLKVWVKTAAIRNYNSIIKSKKREEIVVLAKFKLNSIEVLISEALIDLHISLGGFISMNVLKEYDEIKEEVRNSNKK